MQPMKYINILCISASAEKHYKKLHKILGCPLSRVLITKNMFKKFNLRTSTLEMHDTTDEVALFFNVQLRISLYENMIDIIRQDITLLRIHIYR